MYAEHALFFLFLAVQDRTQWLTFDYYDYHDYNDYYDYYDYNDYLLLFLFSGAPVRFGQGAP